MVSQVAYPLYGRVAFTRRSVPNNLEPIRHSATLRHVGLARSSYAAECGAAIGRFTDEPFTDTHPRACRLCAHALKGRIW